MESIRIENYAPKWEASHIEFAKEYFNGRRKRINPEYIYWKCRGEEGKELPSF